MPENPTEPELQRLEGLELFRNVTREVMEQFKRRAQRRTLQKGELLFNVGDLPTPSMS